jgi:hypothetical protein
MCSWAIGESRGTAVGAALRRRRRPRPAPPAWAPSAGQAAPVGDEPVERRGRYPRSGARQPAMLREAVAVGRDGLRAGLLVVGEEAGIAVCPAPVVARVRRRR